MIDNVSSPNVYSSIDAVQFGGIESILLPSQSIIVDGWAFRPDIGRAATVYAVTDRELRFPATVTARDDVSEHFKNVAAGRSGFRCVIEASKLGPGMHEVQIVALFDDEAGLVIFTLPRFRVLGDDFGALTTAERYALATKPGMTDTHRGQGIARDLLLSVVDDGESSLKILREAATLCQGGRLERAVQLRSQVAERSGSADDYYHLSEMLALTDQLPAAVEALQMAARLDPTLYANLSIELEGSMRLRESVGGAGSLKRGRYPDTDAMKRDLRSLISEYVLPDSKDQPKFISPATRFFTMGSCFSHGVVRAIRKLGYAADVLKLADFFGSTYANRYLLDWFDGAIPEGPLAAQIAHTLPQAWSKDEFSEAISSCGVFILTLGQAPAFFDRESGEFVLPRETALTTRALAERCVFRTTSISENVANIERIISFVRRRNSYCKIVLLESPTPMHMTFEFRSAIVADCLSKSVLRVAAHEVSTSSHLENVYYWPAFEVFRWLGCHTGPLFGTDDNASFHVSESAIDDMLSAFIESYRAM